MPKVLFSFRWSTVFFTLAMVIFLGCEYKSKGMLVNQTVSGRTDAHTHCVGRFLIDLPAGFEQNPASYAELFYGLDKKFRKVSVEVARANGSQPSFDTIVDRRATELATDEHFSSPSKSMLAFRRSIGSDTAILRGYQDSRMLNYFKTTIFARKGAAVGAFQTEVFAEDQPENVEDTLLKLVERTTYFSLSDKATKGTCLSPLLFDAGQDGEILSATFLAKSMPDVVIHIDMNSMVAVSDGGLLKRWDRKNQVLDELNFRSNILRRGKVEISSMAGEELLSSGKDRGHVVRGFSAETLLAKSATFAAPSLAINMNMGGQIAPDDYRDASLSEKEALALWDSIIRSIRLRAGAV